MNLMRTIMRTETGFMGMTHALSAVAVMTAILAFRPAWLESMFGSRSPVVFALMLLIVVAGALMPDLDNTDSSAKSALGIIGKAISWFMRTTAPIIQNIIHLPRDKDLDEPHRGFYHTAVAAVLFGAMVTLFCSDKIGFDVGSFHIGGKLAAIILAFIGVHIAMCTLAGRFMRGLGTKVANGGMVDVVVTLITMVVTVGLWYALPSGTDYTRMGVAFGLGWIIHELGDQFTTAGNPTLWPIPIRGRMWWRIRFLKIKAGGLIENWVFTPVFLAVIIYCAMIVIGII